MNTKDQVRYNILSLLNIQKMTNADLARSTGIDPATITRYLSGERTISEKNLKIIAKCFSLSVEALTNVDFTNPNVVGRDPNVLAKNIYDLFPLFTSEAAQKNQAFHHAYAAHIKLYERYIGPDAEVFTDADDIIVDGYDEASKDDDIKAECIANLLAFFFYSLLHMTSGRFFSAGWEPAPVLAKRVIQAHGDFEREINLEQEAFEELENGFREIIDDPDYFDEITDMYSFLKHKEGWSDLVDYYISLQYIFGMISNTFSYEQNNQFGLELMSTYEACGNKYAHKFFFVMFPEKK